MTKPSLNDIQSLVHGVVLPFYLINRDMDIQITDTKHRKETDAEHAWSIALVGCSIAPLIDAKLDVGKIAQLAIVHDLVEIYAGDVSIWGSKQDLQQKEAREKAALHKLEQEYKQFPWLIKTIQDYESKNSYEALFVYALDKLVPFFFRILVKPTPFERKQITIEQFKSVTQKTALKAHTHPVIGAYFDEMLALFLDHPEYFYKEKQ
jgi:5'-deoxynucleotidase YfbR-like HD superfamily hydrolase